MSMLRYGLTAALAAISMTGAATQSHAGKRGVLTGLGIGVGAAILLNELGKEAQRQQRRQAKPSYSGTGEGGSDRSDRRTASTWMTPSDVSKMQASLNVLGYDAGEEDGRGGQQTTAAVRKFQSSAGERVTGLMTPAQFVSLMQQAQAAASAGPVREQVAPSRTAAPAAANRAVGPAAQPAEAVAVPPAVEPAPPVQAVQESPPPAADGRRRSAPSAGSPNPPAVPQAPAPRARDVAVAGPTNGSANPDGGRALAKATPAANPDLPKVSADGKFTEHRRNRQVSRVFERSSAGRRVAQDACASACLERIKCQAYASFVDGRCELGEAVGETAAGDGSDFAVIGVRRSVEAAAAP